MSQTTISIVRIAPFLQPDIEAAIRSVMDGAEPAWSVTVLNDLESGDWNIGAQPGDGQPFEGVLKDTQHSVQAIQDMLTGWRAQYQEWTLDSDE